MDISKTRKLKLNNQYTPLPLNDGDEVFRNGFFRFNITRILEDIELRRLETEEEQINVQEWFESHYHNRVNEEHLPSVDISQPIVLAEIRPGTFSVIDGNHRLEKAYRENVTFINSYKLKGEQLLPYFTSKERYHAFVDYWNGKLTELR
jgi:hypothetical protein